MIYLFSITSWLTQLKWTAMCKVKWLPNNILTKNNIGQYMIKLLILSWAKYRAMDLYVNRFYLCMINSKPWQKSKIPSNYFPFVRIMFINLFFSQLMRLISTKPTKKPLIFIITDIKLINGSAVAAKSRIMPYRVTEIFG